MVLELNEYGENAKSPTSKRNTLTNFRMYGSKPPIHRNVYITECEARQGRVNIDSMKVPDMSGAYEC